MTRKDYVLLARALKSAQDYCEKKAADGVRVNGEFAYAAVVNAICLALFEENIRFDRARFLRAAGI